MFNNRRRLIALASLAAVAFCSAGCKLILFLGYLIGGPPSVEPEFEVRTKKSFTDKGVTVAIVVYAPTEVRFQFPKVDKDVARYLSHKLASKKIKVVRPEQVNAWLDKNKDWDKPEEIGEALEVTYVVHVELSNYNLYEEGSATLFRGRSEALISVWEMQADGTGEKVFQKELVSKFPLAAPRDTRETTQERFRQEYLTYLAEQIGRFFYPYYNGDDVVNAT